MIVFSYGKRRQFTTVAFSSDAGQLAAGGDYEQIVVWDTATARELHRIDHTITHSTQSLAFHPRAPWLYFACSHGLTAFNTTTGFEHELWGKNEFARNVALDPTGRRLIGARHKLWTNQRDLRWLTCLNVVDPNTPTKEWERTDNDPATDGWTTLVAFFADGERFATAEITILAHRYGTRLSVRSADTGEALRTFHGAGTDADHIAVSPSGDWLVTHVTRRLYVFDVSDASTPARELKNDGRKHFTGIAFHPSGRYLAATSNDETVKLYDTTHWEVAKTFTWKIGRIRSVTFSSDGTLAAAGSDTGKVVVWDVDF